ncbi:hypothetical protein V3C99_007267 [Haemonchus contortus]
MCYSSYYLEKIGSVRTARSRSTGHLS